MFAIDPFTFQWVRLDVTAASDVRTRPIMAFGPTPFPTQGVDLALLLSDLVLAAAGADIGSRRPAARCVRARERSAVGSQTAARSRRRRN